MKGSFSPELISEIRVFLESRRQSGNGYPCAESDLVDHVSSDLGVGRDTVTKALKSDASVKSTSKAKGQPNLVVFAGDEWQAYGMTADAVKSALAASGGSGSASGIAKNLSISNKGAGWECLKERLENLVSEGVIFKQGAKYVLGALTAPPEAADTSRHAEVIRIVGELKKAKKYPSLPREIGAKLSAPKITAQKLLRILRQMELDGALIPAKKGKAKAYMLAGDDPRYARKLDEDLRFELLSEIEELKARILETNADIIPGAHPSPSLPANLEGLVLDAIASIARRNNRPAVDLWELREGLPSVPSGELDRTLEALGRDWKLELRPVQDLTRLSSRQRESLLRLKDGTMVVSVASSD
jgi:hypothetical protein